MGSIIDVGAGIRPTRWCPSARHICVEPFGPYADVLEEAGYDVVRATARDALPGMRAEAVYLLDVLEHMESAEALEVVELAKAAATRQVILYTPVGYVEQDTDVWGMGGDEWQTHRSGWMPQDFPGWSIEWYEPEDRVGTEGFYALWTVT